MDRINQLTHSVLDDIDNCDNLESLENLRVKYFGKMELLLTNLNILSELEKEEKKVGQKLNLIKNKFFENLERKEKY